jgi:hypothetical protein
VKSVFEFSSFTLTGGATLTATGSRPLVIRVTGAADIQGTLQSEGGTGGCRGRGSSIRDGWNSRSRRWNRRNRRRAKSQQRNRGRRRLPWRLDLARRRCRPQRAFRWTGHSVLGRRRLQRP